MYEIDLPVMLILLLSIVKFVFWAFFNTCVIFSTVLSDKSRLLLNESL